MKGYVTPIKAQHRLYDLMSDKTSSEAKLNAARWYAEMMIDLFFSEDIKSQLGNIKFNKLSLLEKINKLKESNPPAGLIDTLYYVKDFGDQGSHYSSTPIAFTEIQIENTIKKALGLFDMALYETLKDGKIAETPSTATILSTFLPATRARVLEKLIDFKNFDCTSEFDAGLLDKYLMALLKDNKKNKAFKKIDSLLKANLITPADSKYLKDKLNIINKDIINGTLPIAKDISDCKRNFNHCISNLSDIEKEKNSKLINIFNIMLEQAEPSSMEGLKPFIVKYY